MNPINSLNAFLHDARTELYNVNKKYESLTKAHGKLVDDFVISENKLELFKVCVSEMCNNCSQKGSLNCENCSLQGVMP